MCTPEELSYSHNLFAHQMDLGVAMEWSGVVLLNYHYLGNQDRPGLKKAAPLVLQIRDYQLLIFVFFNVTAFSHYGEKGLPLGCLENEKWYRNLRWGLQS